MVVPAGYVIHILWSSNKMIGMNEPEPKNFIIYYYVFEDITCEIWTFLRDISFLLLRFQKKCTIPIKRRSMVNWLFVPLRLMRQIFWRFCITFNKNYFPWKCTKCVINWMKKISSKITKLQLFCFLNAFYQISVPKSFKISGFKKFFCVIRLKMGRMGTIGRKISLFGRLILILT